MSETTTDTDALQDDAGAILANHPGPWTHGWWGNGGSHVVRDAKGSIVLNVGGPPDHPQVLALAQALSAFPDLLAVCIAYREECRRQGIKFGSINGDADAAISRATAPNPEPR